MNKKLWIGFDPDAVKSGVAFLTSWGEWSLHVSPLYLVRDLIFNKMAEFKIDGIKNVKALVEAPGADTANFIEVGMFISKRRQFKVKGFKDPEKSALKTVLKMANKKGRCSQVGEELIRLMDHLNISAERIAPSKRIRFDGVSGGVPLNKIGVDQIRTMVKTSKKYQYPSKLNHERFVQLTGVEDKRTNEEKRDAALLLLKTYLKLQER